MNIITYSRIYNETKFTSRQIEREGREPFPEKWYYELSVFKPDESGAPYLIKTELWAQWDESRNTNYSIYPYEYSLGNEDSHVIRDVIKDLDEYLFPWQEAEIAEAAK